MLALVIIALQCYTYCFIIKIPGVFNGAAPEPVVIYTIPAVRPAVPAAVSSSYAGKLLIVMCSFTSSMVIPVELVLPVQENKLSCVTNNGVDTLNDLSEVNSNPDNAPTLNVETYDGPSPPIPFLV